ncbi:hypothetical protein Ssi02_57040 [Sinosporangium siamense]|uniref:Uncharacterized protein n=1 Tax=Sinosporangium siamense TaxID=1367973 RepID=A0A919RKJ1_9ACTN|nr:hypothetical protein Ssi02_57040 [Sinosporangium siamense]
MAAGREAAEGHARGDPADEQVSGVPPDGPAGDLEDASPADAYALFGQEALTALLRGGAVQAEEQEAREAAAIATRVLERFERAGVNPNAGTVALFNDEVTIGGGFHMVDPSAGRSADPAGTVSQIGAAELAHYTEHHVYHPRFDEALGILMDHHLLVVASAPRSGRKSFAINLLAETLATRAWGDSPGACYVVDDPEGIGRTGWSPPHKDSGYLAVFERCHVSGLRRTWARAIDEDWIAQVTAVLRESGSYMVLVTDPPQGALVEAATRSPQVMTSLQTVDLVRVVERRVLGHSPAAEARAALRRRLAECDALHLLREVPQPGVAERLSLAILAGEDLTALVKSQRDPDIQVHAWFGLHHDLGSVSFAISSAALEGAGYLTVSDAAVALHTLLATGRQDTPDQPAAPVMPDLRFRDRLSADLPWIEVAFAPGEDGRTALPRVVFRNPSMRHAVLGYVWTHLDGYRAPLLEWLRSLITHSDVDVRGRAAVFAGVIARCDFHHAVHRFLRAWAESDSPAMRQATASALEAVDKHPALSAKVWVLLSSWADQQPPPAGQGLTRTVLATLAGPIGRDRPVQALAILRRILDREDAHLLHPVCQCVQRLLDHGHTAEVLEALLSWSDLRHSPPATVKAALWAFTYLTCRPGADDAAALGEAVPVLLTRAPRYRRQLVELWTRALADGQAQEQALKALRHLVEHHAVPGRRTRLDLGDLLTGIAGRDDRHRARLTYYLDKWARERKTPATSLYTGLIRVR